MARFRLQGAHDRIQDSLRQGIKVIGGELTRDIGSEMVEVPLENNPRYQRLTAKVRIMFERHERICEMSSGLPMRQQIVMIVCVLGLPLILCLMIGLVFLKPRFVDAHFWPFLFGISAIAVTTVWAYQRTIHISKIRAECERKFLERVKDLMPCELLSAVGVDMRLELWFLPLCIGGIGAVLLFCHWISDILLVIMMPFVILVASLQLLILSAKRNPAVHFQHALGVFACNWSLLLSGVTTSFVLLLIFDFAIINGQRLLSESEFVQKSHSVFEFLRMPKGYLSIPKINQPENRVQTLLHDARNVIRHQNETLQEEQLARRAEMVLAAVGGVILILVVACTCLVISGPVLMLFRSSRIWQNSCGTSQPGQMQPPSTVEIAHKGGYLAVMVFLSAWIAGGWLHWLSFGIAVEGLKYVLTGKCISSLATHIFVLFTAIATGVGRFLTPSCVHLWTVGVSLFIVFVTLPVVYFIVRKTVRFLLRTIPFILPIQFEGDEQERFNKFSQDVTVLAEHCGVSRPKVRLVYSYAMEISTSWPLLATSPRLVVTKRALVCMTPKELRASVMHEMGHMKHDMRIVRLTRWLSSLALFPCPFFSLCLNLRQREFRADQFALECGADVEAFKSAIATTSVVGSGTEIKAKSTAFLENVVRRWPILGRLRSPWLRLWFLDEFLFSGRLLNYVHPLPTERAAKIDAWLRQQEVPCLGGDQTDK